MKEVRGYDFGRQVSYISIGGTRTKEAIDFRYFDCPGMEVSELSGNITCGRTSEARQPDWVCSKDCPYYK